MLLFKLSIEERPELCPLEPSERFLFSRIEGGDRKARMGPSPDGKLEGTPLGSNRIPGDPNRVEGENMFLCSSCPGGLVWPPLLLRVVS